VLRGLKNRTPGFGQTPVGEKQMSEKKVVKPLALAVGVALAGTFAISGTVNADSIDSPFEISTLSVGYMLGEGEGSCGGDKDKAEEKEGEGSCGEGSCGGDKEGEGHDKEGEGSCGDDKEGEGSCGDDKEGEGSCGGDDKEETEGSCGGSI
jgi:uncharacterized low-complexity protein